MYNISLNIILIRRIYIEICYMLYQRMKFFFQAFLNSGAMASVLDSFCIYHVTAPGQEPGAKDLPDGFVYPNMDELSEQVSYI